VAELAPASPCPLCQKPGQRDGNFENYLKLSVEGGFQVFGCRSCAFRWLDPIPDPEYIQRLYSKEYFEGGFSYTTQVATQAACYGRRMEALLGFRGRAGGRLLDVGCATGEFLDVARQHGFAVQGLEVSEYSVVKARKKGLDVVHGMLEQMSRVSPFDVVTCSHVLEHLPSPVHALQQIHDLLLPGGLLYLEVPYQYEGLVDVIARLRGEDRPFGVWSVHHRSFFTPRSLRQLAEASNFDLLSATTFLPCRRHRSDFSLRVALLQSALFLADRLWSGGDVIALWVRRRD